MVGRGMDTGGKWQLLFFLPSKIDHVETPLSDSIYDLDFHGKA
jgi:hypothetical protein